MHSRPRCMSISSSQTTPKCFLDLFPTTIVHVLGQVAHSRHPMQDTDSLLQKCRAIPRHLQSTQVPQSLGTQINTACNSTGHYTEPLGTPSSTAYERKRKRTQGPTIDLCITAETTLNLSGLIDTGSMGGGEQQKLLRLFYSIHSESARFRSDKRAMGRIRG